MGRRDDIFDEIAALATAGQYGDALGVLSELRAAEAGSDEHLPHLYELWEACLIHASGDGQRASSRLSDAVRRARELGFELDAVTAWRWLDELALDMPADWRVDYLRGMLAALDDASGYGLELLDSALAHIDQDMDPDGTSLVLQDAAWVARREFDARRAAEYLERAREITPDDLYCLIELGRAYGLAGSGGKALEPLRHALSLEPENQDVRLQMALAHHSLRDYDCAMDHLEEARQLTGPDGEGTGRLSSEEVEARATLLIRDAAADSELAQAQGEPTAALLRAYQARDLDAARSALEAGADPNASYEYCGGPLLVSAAADSSDWVTLLLDFGADPNIRGQGGWTALQSVRGRSMVDVAGVLIERGATVDAKRDDGGTALTDACLDGNDASELVELLVAAGADPHLATFMKPPWDFVSGLSDTTLLDAMKRGLASRVHANTAPPGWHADPLGRHQHRYWDGSSWTSHVSDSGVQSQDAQGL